MYKWVLSIIIIAFIILISYISINIFAGLENQPEKNPVFKSEVEEPEEEKTDNDEELELTELSEDKAEENKEKGYLNTFGDPKKKEEVKEEVFKIYMNYMAHQKVYADHMWGFYEITPDRINFLFEVLEIKTYEHEDVYKEILTRWKEGDFSQAVQDHNKIWRLQNGNVGRATRLLTDEEEQAILKKHNQ
ncbi:hypothetical protein SAMN04487943_101511 [Gracilibacillus orientalis]|uniref:Uncharacterized protein n=1 Tax=Gracilibacillus orientalis TaxID=334253 RepID=A0A1I4HNZ0_9BACI|nr:DUF6241 domain-containing protein [Gracilibacillus orientalis]SFL43106.1 hypothetical protein SAMN04487943_101511 [Gracilibacillus orientalis]